MNQYNTKEDVLEKLSVLQKNNAILPEYDFLLKVPNHLQTPDIITKVLNQFSFAVKYLTQTEDVCIEAVKINSYTLTYIENKQKNDKLFMTAIKADGMALQFVENQTEEMVLSAIKQNPASLQFVKNQTPEICLEALNSKHEIMQRYKIHTDIKIVDKKYLNNVDECTEQLNFMIKKKEIIMTQL